MEYVVRGGVGGEERTACSILMLLLLRLQLITTIIITIKDASVLMVVQSLNKDK